MRRSCCSRSGKQKGEPHLSERIFTHKMWSRQQTKVFFRPLHLQVIIGAVAASFSLLGSVSLISSSRKTEALHHPGHHLSVEVLFLLSLQAHKVPLGLTFSFHLCASFHSVFVLFTSLGAPIALPQWNSGLEYVVGQTLAHATGSQPPQSHLRFPQRK